MTPSLTRPQIRARVEQLKVIIQRRIEQGEAGTIRPLQGELSYWNAKLQGKVAN